MGQAATLYRLTEKTIESITDNAGGNNWQKNATGCETFEKSFEGIRFILSVNATEEDEELIHQVFYPESHIGEAIDFEDIDLDNIPENFDWSTDAIYYNEPDVVKQIATFLNSISSEQFLLQFNAEELNQNDVYPGNVWTQQDAPDHAFTPSAMLAEFNKLKALYTAAAASNECVMVLVG